LSKKHYISFSQRIHSKYDFHKKYSEMNKDFDVLDKEFEVLGVMSYENDISDILILLEDNNKLWIYDVYFEDCVWSYK
jgi:hypothetical protein